MTISDRLLDNVGHLEKPLTTSTTRKCIIIASANATLTTAEKQFA